MHNNHGTTNYDDGNHNEDSNVTCCLCFPIRIGVWILAIFALIGASLMIVANSGGLAFRAEALEKVNAEVEQNGGRPFVVPPGIVIATYAVKIGLGVLHLLFSILLIRGLLDRKPQHLKTWVTFKLVLLGIAVAALVLGCVMVMVMSKGGDGVLGGFTILLFGGLVLLLEFYYIWVVRRYARIMENENYASNMTYVISYPQKA